MQCVFAVELEVPIMLMTISGHSSSLPHAERVRALTWFGKQAEGILIAGKERWGWQYLDFVAFVFHSTST